MRKFITVGLATIASLLLIFAVIFTSMEIVLDDQTFLENEFTELDISTKMGISNADLVASTTRLIEYMQGKVGDIRIDVTMNGQTVDMFELEQEDTHMQDVRTLYLRFKQYRDSGVLAMLILFLAAAVINFKKAQQTLAQGYLSGAFIATLFVGFLGTWAASDFTSFWTFFHQMLFWNNLWLFDASESRMINMLPEQIFSAIIGRIFLYAGIVIVLLIAASIFALIFTSASYKKKRAAAIKKQHARKSAAAAAAKARSEARAAKKREREKAKKRKEKEKRKAKAAKQSGKKTPKQKSGGQPAPAATEPAAEPATEPADTDGAAADVIVQTAVYTEDEEGYPAENSRTEGAPDNEDVASIDEILSARKRPWREGGAESDSVDASDGEPDADGYEEDGYEPDEPARGGKGKPRRRSRLLDNLPVIEIVRPEKKPKQKAAPKAKSPKKPKQPKSGIQDDTGFFDE